MILTKTMASLSTGFLKSEVIIIVLFTKLVDHLHALVIIMTIIIIMVCIKSLLEKIRVFCV